VKSYSPEVKEQAARTVLGHQGEDASQWEAICSIAAKIGCNGATLRNRVRRHERDAGLKDGMRSEARDRLKALVGTTRKP
jgi:transposase-like protein